MACSTLIVRTMYRRSGIMALRRLGIEPVVCATARIEPIGFDAHTPCDALILTSAAAVPCVPAHWYALPVFCVGAATARAARRVGLLNVQGIAPDVAVLLANLPPVLGFGRVVHLGGEQLSQDIAGSLRDQGHDAVHVPCYRLVTRSRAAPAVAEALRCAGVQHVLVTSVQAAMGFDHILKQVGLASAWAGFDIHAISARVAEAVPAAPRSVHVAPSPDMRGLVKSLQSRLTLTPS